MLVQFKKKNQQSHAEALMACKYSGPSFNFRGCSGSKVSGTIHLVLLGDSKEASTQHVGDIVEQCANIYSSKF